MLRQQQRHFNNPYPDFSQNPFAPNRDELKQQIIVTSHLVLTQGNANEYDGGIYVGPAGLAYLAVHLFRNPSLLSDFERKKVTEMAKVALDNHLNYYKKLRKHDKNDPAAFMLGKGGVNAVGAVFGKLTGDATLLKNCLEEFVSAAKICKPLEFRKGGSDELFVGRAGYLCGALWLQENLGGQPIPKEDLRAIWRAIIDSGKAYAARNGSPCPLMYSYYDTEYLGAAHGISSILQILLSFPEFCREFPDDEIIILQTIDYYLTLQDQSGNFPSALDEVDSGTGNLPKSSKLLHWCHGAPGAVYMFAKAFLHSKEEKYLNAAAACGEAVWKMGLLLKGPGICHGIAGSGYVFLILNKLFEGKDGKHLYRAAKFAEFLNSDSFRDHARTPDCPYSLYEGQAGTVCFLADLMFPDGATFPFFDIYYNYQ